MAALNMVQLRSLARLYRDGVEGAAEQLDADIEERADQLAAIIGFPPGEIPRLRATTDRVDVLVRTIEKAGAHHAAERRASARSCAERLVQGLLDSARRVDAEHVEVDPMALSALVTCGGYDWLVLDTEYVVRGIPRGLLRAFFRECRGVEVQSARIGTNVLALCYRGPRSRGVLRLAFHHIPGDADALAVPVQRVPFEAAHEPVPRRTRHSVEAREETARSTSTRKLQAHQHDTQDVDAPAPRRRERPRPPAPPPQQLEARPPRRSNAGTRRFLRHLVDAIVEGL